VLLGLLQLLLLRGQGLVQRGLLLLLQALQVLPQARVLRGRQLAAALQELQVRVLALSLRAEKGIIQAGET
jgi:hypothetical protein